MGVQGLAPGRGARRSAQGTCCPQTPGVDKFKKIYFLLRFQSRNWVGSRGTPLVAVRGDPRKGELYIINKIKTRTSLTQIIYDGIPLRLWFTI